MRPEAALPLFLPAGDRRLFGLHHVPPGPAKGAIVHVPAFAEEMNKSRRMVALQSRALARAGWHVLQLDLTGTGDSSGDFGEATWRGWLDDVVAASAWLAQASGHAPWLWGLRLGALVAAEACGRSGAPGLLGWQPVLSGRQHLQQFLRLKAGSEWLSGKGEAEAQARPMEDLQAGRSVEVAGYTLHADLALPMAEAVLKLPAGVGRVAWLEVSPRSDANWSPATERTLAAARQAADVKAVRVQGPSFWQALEIEEAPALLDATVNTMEAW